MELDEATAVLGSADFFRICTDEQIRLLAFAGEWRRFSEGAYLYRAGDISDGAHVLVSGRLLSGGGDNSGEASFRIEAQGDLVGEAGLIVARPRRTSVKAETEAETLFVPRHAFIKLLQQYPDMAARAEARLRQTLGGYVDPLTKLAGKLKPR